MTTSGVTAWEMTARDIVTAALRDARILASGRDPKAAELEDCILRLNGMLKSMSSKANLFRETEANVTVTGGTGMATLPAGVRDVSGVRHVLSATNERSLTPWPRADYAQMPNKTTVGNPSVYYLSRQRDAAVLRIWPVPAAAVTLKLDYSRVAETITDASQTVDIPQEWQETIYKNLAVECAELFGATLTPRYIAKAEALYQQMLDSDRPDFYTFESYSAYD